MRAAGFRRLILWDIDGTLLLAGPAGREIFDSAMQRVLEREIGDHGIRMAGKTDPQIALEIMAALDIAEHDAHGHLSRVVVELERALEAAADRIRTEGVVLPGVRELLQGLDATDGVVQTVLTGNLEANAVVKLSALGLDGWLDLTLGAYGSDHHDRRELVTVCLRKVEEKFGWRPAPDQTWVVGDTPADHACAAAAGVRCLLVGTAPRVPFTELEACGADALVQDLSDTDAILQLLLEA